MANHPNRSSNNVAAKQRRADMLRARAVELSEGTWAELGEHERHALYERARSELPPNLDHPLYQTDDNN